MTSFVLHLTADPADLTAGLTLAELEERLRAEITALIGVCYTREEVVAAARAATRLVEGWANGYTGQLVVTEVGRPRDVSILVNGAGLRLVDIHVLWCGVPF